MANDNLILLDTFVKEFWEKKDKRLSRVLSAMDNVEFWVFEEEEGFAQGVNRIGRYMSEASPEKIEQVIDNLVVLMAYMSSSKSMRMLNWIEENHPQIFQKMMARLPQHFKPKAAGLLGARMRVMNNLELMGRVFNPQRSQRISAWLKSEMPQQESF
jgi:hypothetical protein